jgi:hypothetical protein
MAKGLISVPDDKLKRIDALAKSRGKSRSAFVVETVPSVAGTPRFKRPIDDPVVRAAYERILEIRKRAKPGPDATTIIREMRNHSKY